MAAYRLQLMATKLGWKLTLSEAQESTFFMIVGCAAHRHVPSLFRTYSAGSDTRLDPSGAGAGNVDRFAKVDILLQLLDFIFIGRRVTSEVSLHNPSSL